MQVLSIVVVVIVDLFVGFLLALHSTIASQIISIFWTEGFAPVCPWPTAFEICAP